MLGNLNYCGKDTKKMGKKVCNPLYTFSLDLQSVQGIDNLAVKVDFSIQYIALST